MKTATIPSLRVEPALREAAESVLREGETLSGFVEASLRAQVRQRQLQEEFIKRGLASLEEAKRTGVYKRQAVYEFLVMSPRLRELVVPGAEADTIHRVAVEEGMRPITQAAVALARSGAISLAEAWRVRAD